MRARERLEQELEVARLIQQNFLPKQLPQLAGWRVAAYYRPARTVGGDFYDFIELPDGLIGLVVGDVTDKGVPAAMVMAATRSVLRAAAQRLLEPGAVLRRVNETLCSEIPPNMFVTCLYGVLDPATGLLRYANAGHNLPIVHRAGVVSELRATGMPLGLMPGMDYDEKEATLAPGSSVLLYSDGLTEAHDPDREMFGTPRVRERLAAGRVPDDLISDLVDQLDRFTRRRGRAGGRHHPGRARAHRRWRRRAAPCSSSRCRAPRATSARRWRGWARRPRRRASKASAWSG